MHRSAVDLGPVPEPAVENCIAKKAGTPVDLSQRLMGVDQREGRKQVYHLPDCPSSAFQADTSK